MTSERIRILQIGAGSMGNRRLRDLSKQGQAAIALFDQRDDRRAEARTKYGIEVFDRLEDALAWRPEALIISTPPDAHTPYIELALEKGLHHFSEANIWTYDFETIERTAVEKNLVCAVSCSMSFLPVVREMKRIVREELGRLYSYQMLLSTYARSWHPQEGMEYYARHRSTAPAREMVPFELEWLSSAFGSPVGVIGSVDRMGDSGVDSEDTWSLQMKLANGASGQFICLMPSPATVRGGVVVGENGAVRFDLMTGRIRRDLPNLKLCDDRDFSPIKDVLEQAYYDEITTFVDAVRGRVNWPYSYRNNAVATATLAAAEKSVRTRSWHAIDPGAQPGEFPDTE